MKNIIIPVLLFTLTMTITPGPNNMLLTASGARFGFRKTLPFIGGIVLGIISQLLLSALGLGYLFEHYPLAQKILKITGSLYILFLAYHIANPSDSHRKGSQSIQKPIQLVQGALFQYLNPKAYIMTITAMSVYPLQGELYLRSSLFILLSFVVICPLSISLWAAFGTLLKVFMKEGKHAGKVNIFLGVITAFSVVFILR